jgi:restriction system protein
MGKPFGEGDKNKAMARSKQRGINFFIDSQMTKQEKLKKLALERKTFCFDGFKKISEFQNGAFDVEDYVSPWSIGAHNFNADLMLIGQDWASSKWLSNPKNLNFSRLGQNPNLMTNKNLNEYLKYFGLNFSDTYATNAFVLVKEGNMSAKITPKFLYESIKKFLVPQIEIVKPKMIICLGAETYNALRKENGYPELKVGSGQEIAMPFMGADVYGVNHTGGHGTKNAGGKESARKQWQILAGHYQRLKSQL